jgi:hypothetical protein
LSQPHCHGKAISNHRIQAKKEKDSRDSVRARLDRIGEDGLQKEAVTDMTITDWIIRAAIFGVLAAVVIGTFQNLYTAIKNRGKK